jgi:hypothetical protein
LPKPKFGLFSETGISFSTVKITRNWYPRTKK